MTELEKTKIELKFSINLFSRFCELVEKDLGTEKVIALLFLAQAKAIDRELNNDIESNEDKVL
ncbi:hypothetical protein EDX97_07855 [Absicoccus porci]|uniref:Uncharacterized protein n=1 Tax=Absicoccus porci TaxID=2486576 RepID=A0A3N0I0X2_9FIRM|nr:hypothetical protein [Absicoccus porci]RNM30685.1 hypothetical protein EDX97_07855 [Absicoccus porci]